MKPTLSLLLLLTATPARAGTTATALEILCGPRGVQYTDHVEAASRRYLLHPVRLVALVAAESTCDARAVNRRTGAQGLGQIMPGKSADVPGADLFDPATNLRLTARHISRLETLCGSFGGAVRVYHGHRKCRGWRRDQHALRVLAMEAGVWRELQRRRIGRS